MAPIRERWGVVMFASSLATIILFVTLLTAPWSRGRDYIGRAQIELEASPERAGGARAQYQHAEKIMKQALEKAHDYEKRAEQQQQLEKQDQRMHYELIKAARDRADELREQDRKVSKVSDVRERMADAMRATTSVLALHERRLEDLLAEQREATVKLKREQEDVDGLQHSANVMDASVEHLQTQTAHMRQQFKQEEKDTTGSQTVKVNSCGWSDLCAGALILLKQLSRLTSSALCTVTSASKSLEKMLSLYSSKQAAETARENQAPTPPP